MADETAAATGADDGHDIAEEGDRSMGFLGAAAIGVGTMIAAGIFVLSGLAVSRVGTVAIVSFLIAALVASLTAAAYAEFASVYPESGGGYVYVARTIPSELTFIMGWTMILGYPASAAFYLGSFAKWFHEFLYAPLSIPAAIPYWIAGLVILGLLVALNLAGSEESGTFQVVVTSLKVLLIAFFLYGASKAFDPAVVASSFGRNLTEFANIGVTSALVFITFFGFSAIATDAEEIEDPGSTIPKAIYFSMAFVSVVYALVVIAIVLAVNDPAFVEVLRNQVNLGGASPAAFVADNGELAMGLAARTYLGAIGFYVVVAGALVSMLSAANATILAGSRVKLALARNGHLPGAFAETHDDWGTPYRSVLLTGGLILSFLAIFTVVFYDGAGLVLFSGLPLGVELGLEGLANFANFLLIVGLTVVNLALIRSRQRFPEIERGFEVPFVPWVPILGVVGNGVLLSTIVLRHPTIAGLGVLAEILGAGFWFAVVRGGPSTDRLEAETPTALAEHASTDHDYRLVVPIANEDHVDRLMHTATDLAAERDAEVVAMSAATLPRQTPYDEGHDRAEERRPIVDRAMDLAEDAGVPVSGTVRLTRDPADAILNTVEQYDADGVLLGWGGRGSRRRDVVLGSTVDDVAKEADADVFVENVGAGHDEFDSILLPWTDSVHDELAAATAAAVARADGASIDVVHVIDDEDPGTAEEMLANAESTLAQCGERPDASDLDVDSRAIEGDDVVEALIEEAEAHDATVLGAAREGILQRLVFGAVPERVANRVGGATIVCQRDVGAPSRLKRLLT